MVQYRHSMSRALAVGLYRLFNAKAPVNISSLNLTRNQWDNFQKLRYWDLVEKAQRPDGKRIGGVWAITPAGRAFVGGATRLPKAVWTYRGERVRYETEAGDVAFVQCVTSEDLAQYETRPEYAAKSKPKPKNPPGTDLFGPIT